jgi:hypothetical protein
VDGIKEYNDDLISDSIYLSVLKRSYNYYKLFNGTLNSYLNKNGIDKLKENLKLYFDRVCHTERERESIIFWLKFSIFKFIEKKLNIKNCDLLNTFNGMQFMTLDKTMFLKIQSLLNKLEETILIIDKVFNLFCLFICLFGHFNNSKGSCYV